MEQIIFAYGLLKENVTARMMFFGDMKIKVFSPNEDIDFNNVAGVLQEDILAPYLFLSLKIFVFIFIVISTMFWPSSGVCRTQEPSWNFGLRPLLNPRGSPVLIPVKYSCIVQSCSQD